MDSVAYLYFMNPNAFSEMIKSEEYNIGKKSTPVYGETSNGRRILRKDYSGDNLYYFRTESGCREGLSNSIESNRDKISNLFSYHPSMIDNSMKTFLRLNTKHYFREPFKVKEVIKTLKNLIQTGKNEINVVSLGNCIGIDYYGYPNIPMVSLLSYILRDCQWYIINNKDATIDDFINAILTYKVYKKSEFIDFTSASIGNSAFFHAFGVYILTKYPNFITNYSYTTNLCNGIKSWLQYLTLDGKEIVKRMREFINTYDCKHLLDSKFALSGYSTASKCGTMKELELIEQLYLARDGKGYV